MVAAPFGNSDIPPLPQPGSNGTKVNTEAMVTFANNIDQLKQMVLDSIGDLEPMKLAAGG